MKIQTINAGALKLDGGAMFGVVPKKIWEKSNEADDRNRIELTVRCLLIEIEGRKILIDAGLGNKQTAKFFGFYDWNDENKLVNELKKIGIAPEEITDLFLTHLHFDHCGGATYKDDDGNIRLTFPNASVWTNQKHWQWAIEPNEREAASFLKENLLPLQESGKLRFVDEGHNLPFQWITVDGHTEAQMLPIFNINGHTFLFMADLLPTAYHVPLPYIMGYDMQPLKTLEERKKWFTKAAEEGWHLILEHDAINECCSLKIGERGVQLDKTYALSDIDI